MGRFAWIGHEGGRGRLDCLFHIWEDAGEDHLDGFWFDGHGDGYIPPPGHSPLAQTHLIGLAQPDLIETSGSGEKRNRENK